MTSFRHSRTLTCCVAAAALVTSLAACSSSEKESPTSTTPTTTTSSPASESPTSPTEKSINPTGGNLFTPEITAPGPPTPAPGNLPGNHPR